MTSDTARVRMAWALAVAAALTSRAWNALGTGVLRGFDAWGHVSYALFLDLYHAVPYADQGWSYFHPPLHYLFGFLLAQAGDAMLLVRGLGAISSAASLGVAALAGWVVQRALPGRPLLAPLAFLAVAFVPVHVYTSPMPGNEQTGAFFASLGFALFLRNELRDAPTPRGDVAAGAAIGLGLLAKFSGLLPLLAALATLAHRALRDRGGSPIRALRRGALLAGTALLVASPYYARNWLAFGTPFQLSRNLPLVAAVESDQAPGSRTWRDLVVPAPAALLDPDVRAPHLLHSIWGSAYVHAWTDARTDLAFAPKWTRFLPLWLGLLPTGLAVAGFALSLRCTLRGGSRSDAALIALTLVNLGAYALMAYRVPTWAMLKASYLLQLSLPYGLFLARALDALLRRGWRRAAGGASAWLLAAALAAAAAFAPGLATTWGNVNAAFGPVAVYFGDFGRARAVYQERLAETFRPQRRAWLSEALAAAHLAGGQPEEARALYARFRNTPVEDFPQLEARESVWVLNRLAVASALAGERHEAAGLLDEALARDRSPELLVNRAALRGLAGELAAAESEVREALSRDPGLAPAWHNLAWLLERRGQADASAEARHEAERLAWAAPRGFPYGVGDGYHIAGQRFMLVLDADGPALYRPARARPREP